MTVLDQATILAIGTELTSGQITNRNAPWLSEKLAELGIETVLHETVADDRAMILSALDRCATLSGLIFVTGGLGPTTDDFTRDVVADWVDRPLKFHEPSWLKIHDRLTRLGVPVAESNRQQAYYPENSQVIVNPIGTADAFTLESAEGRQIWILPGPPREVESVWNGTIRAQVRAHRPHLKPLQLLTWQCIGKSEAELGELTERALAGSGLKTGYRAHRPYVEVKVWGTDEDIRSKAPALQTLELAIGPWVAARQGEDLATQLLELLTRADEIEITDSASGGILAERLGQCCREPAWAELAKALILTTEWSAPADPEAWVNQVLDEADPTTLQLAIAGINDQGQWALGLREGARVRVEAHASPYSLQIEHRDRSRRFVVEFALKRWSEWLKTAIQ